MRKDTIRHCLYVLWIVPMFWQVSSWVLLIYFSEKKTQEGGKR